MRTRATSSIRPAARRARSSSPSGARSSRPWTMGPLQPDANQGGREPFFLDREIALLDPVFPCPHPAGLLFESWVDGPALSLAVRLEATLRFPGEGLRIPRGRF